MDSTCNIKRIRAAVMGYGAMGRIVRDEIEKSEDIEFVGAVEPLNFHDYGDDGRPLDCFGEDDREKGSCTATGERGVYGSLDAIAAPIDVIIDFSHPGNIKLIDKYINEGGRLRGLVTATTGYGIKEKIMLEKIADRIPVVFAANFSRGITAMKKCAVEMADDLGSAFDVEIVEKHHNKKLDAPSGTAKMLADALNASGEYDYIYKRDGMRKRGNEIGILAVRGGSITGEHTVIFAGEGEVIEITHRAESKRIFALGALEAVRVLWRFNGGENRGNDTESGKVGFRGVYDMDDVMRWTKNRI